VLPAPCRKLSCSLIALFANLLWAAAVPAQSVRLVVSSRAGDRLAAKPPLQFAKGRSAKEAAFEIMDSVSYQKMDGFGASLMEAGIIVLNDLPAEQQESVLRSLFDATQGAGFTAMKTPIAGTDFMSAGPWYTYDDHPEDLELKHFSIARDLGPNGMVTFIKRARRYGNFALQAPMDYPPDWMLYDVKTHQDIDPRYFPTLARYYVRYLQEYEKQGITIDYLSLFNEPDVYTKIPYTSIRELLRDHVGPQLKQSGLRTRIMLSEAPDRSDASKNYPLVLDDPEARRFVSAIPYHGYEFNDYEKIAELHKRYPEFPLWMTEVCYAYEAGTPASLSLPVYEFEDGDFWGQQIFNDLENYASAWIYWNMILDEKGGPWAVSPIHGNPDPNIQHPVVIINRKTKQVTYTGLYYYLTHFSRFVRPGAVRVQTTGSAKGVRVISFRTPDGGIVSELMNSSKEDTAINLVFHDRTVQIILPAVSITTASWSKPGG